MKIIITLTTTPNRLKEESEHAIKKCIYSLINQDFDKEYEIHFNIPEEHHKTKEKYIIPEWIKNLANENSKLKIFENLQDIGSITKIFYTVQREIDPDSIIVVCDDDLEYHPKMLQQQVNNQFIYENTAVGYDGVRAERDNGEELFGDVRDHFVVSVYRNIYVSWLQHYKTVSYKRNFFKEDFKEFIKLGSWNDDITVSAYMTKVGIKKLVTFYEDEEKLITEKQWQEKGGVLTFPVLSHIFNQYRDGCTMYRDEHVDGKFHFFLAMNYLK